MTVRAFTGGAGCGKTYQLMRSLSVHLEIVPLLEDQKVLALTFFHGSRRRLEERLASLQTLNGRTECSTIDSFAWRLVKRWKSLAATLGFTNIEPDQFDKVCDAAGVLLQVHEVCGWVAATFPVLLIDEAQDMTPNRLLIVDGLAKKLEVFAAADEFQCLNEGLRPNPACQWLDKVCTAQTLTAPRRTSNAELLDAAEAIRSGNPPVSGKAFRIALTPKPPLAGAWINSNLQWFGGGRNVALITPTLGTFATKATEWAGNSITKGGAGPYTVPWEGSEASAITKFLDSLKLDDLNESSSMIQALKGAEDQRAKDDLLDWLNIQRRACSKVIFLRAEITDAVAQSFAQRRRTQNRKEGGWRGMTVHGAKNREFDNVIVLWPAAIGGSDDQKRRLLYNAVTRAKARCLVLVQAKKSLEQSPFT